MSAQRQRGRGPRPLWEQEATWCIHFTGMMNKTCKVGIDYDSVKDDEQHGLDRFPCFKNAPSDPIRTDLCPSAAYLTEEQARAKADETLRHLAAKSARMAEGFCPNCDQKVESKRQVSPCIYAEPCGHRLGQRRLK